jgi:hypothetical protein
MEYISQMMRYFRACGSYQDFLDRGLLLTRKLLTRGFHLLKLKLSLRKLYGRYHDMEVLHTLREPKHIFLIRASNSLKFEAAGNLCSLFMEVFTRFARNFKTGCFIILHRINSKSCL